METTNETKYVGKVIDRMTGKAIYTSRAKATWADAQQAAEKAAKNSGDRYKIVVE